MSLLLLLAGSGSGVEPISGGVAGPAGSTIGIDWSPTTDPFESPVWESLASHVRFASGVTSRRGRSSELNDFQAGTASFVLNNRTRLFDPTNTAGTYYGNIKPLRRCRIRVEYNAIVYDLFSGYITGWPQIYGGPADREATVPINLIDGFGVLALATLFDSDGAFTLDSATLGVLDEDRLGVSGADDPIEGYSGELAEALLSAVAYPDIACDTGLSPVTADIPTGGVLAKLKELERSEDGFFYIAGDGTATFLERTARQTLTRISTSQATFDDDGTDSRYADVSFDYDWDNLFNDIRRTGVSGQPQSAEDQASIDSYFRRTDEDTLLTVSDPMTRDLAVLFLDRHKEPMVRAGQLTIPIMRDPAVLFPAAVGRELLDRVTLRRTPQNVGSVYSSEQLTEGITHSFNTEAWTTTLDLSPGYISAWFTLDSATLGVLDEDQLGG